MPIISLKHFEKLQLGGSGSAVGILQTDGNRNRNITYLLDSQPVSGYVKSQRSLYHTEFELDEREGQDHGVTHIGSFPYKRVFYNLYDMKDIAGKTRMESTLRSTVDTLWQLDANAHHDNYCPVLSVDPVDFTGNAGGFFVLTEHMKASPLIKTTDLLFRRNEITDKSTGRITTTEWSYQISSSTVSGDIPTYGYAALSNLEYPGIHVPISSLYIYIDSRPLSVAVQKLSPYTTVGAVSSQINANDGASWQLAELTSNFGEEWQRGIVSGYKFDGTYGAPPFENTSLCSFYNSVIHYPKSYVDFVFYHGGDPGISALLINKYDFDGMDYNYVYWTNTNFDANQFTAGEAWFDMLYGKNSYTARYSQQFAPDGSKPDNAVPGNFNRSRQYSGIGIGGGIAFLKYYDDMNYASEGPKDVVVEETDFSTVQTHKIKDGDAPLSSVLQHTNDLSVGLVTKRSYPHIEQLKQMNVMVNQSMHPSNLYKIELSQDYLKKLFQGIGEQLPVSEAVDTISEIQNDIQNSIREIAKKFAPATTELLTVEFPQS